MPSLGSYYLEGQIVGAAALWARYSYSQGITVGNNPPVGLVDSPVATAVTGWAIDTDSKGTPLTVTLNVDGVAFGSMTANISRPELVKTYGSGNHWLLVRHQARCRRAFTALMSMPTIPPMARYRTYRDADHLHQSPARGKIPDVQRVHLHTAGRGISGFRATPSQIQYTIDGGPPTVVTASVARPDLQASLGSTSHGFVIGLPQLKAGVHKVAVYAIDSTTQVLTLLGTKSATVVGPTGNKLPRAKSKRPPPRWSKGGPLSDGTTPKASISVRR